MAQTPGPDRFDCVPPLASAAAADRQGPGGEEATHVEGEEGGHGIDGGYFAAVMVERASRRR